MNLSRLIEKNVQEKLDTYKVSVAIAITHLIYADAVL